MKTRIVTQVLLVLAIMITLEACFSQKDITKRSELVELRGEGPLRVLATNGNSYIFGEFECNDSTISGAAVAEVKGVRLGETSFVTLRFSEIAFIQTEHFNFWKTLVRGSGVVLIAGVSASAVNAEPGLRIHRYSSSCPFVYSWDGREYQREGEAFGIGFGKALQLTTRSVLPSLKEDHSQLRLRLTNERPETHYFNAVELVAVEADSSASIIADATNTLWPVYDEVPPNTAMDCSGKNILGKIRAVDRDYWESDLSQTSVFSDFQDVLEMTFVRRAFQEEGSLVLHAINTKFPNTVFESIFQFMGNQSLAFLQAAEQDPEMIAILKRWVVDGSMKASIWNGKEWEKIGMVYPEANVVPFSRLIRFRADKSPDDTVRIRLSCLADTWKVDGVQVDWTPVRPIKTRTAELHFGIGPDGKDISSELRRADDQYAVLFPQEQIELTFDAIRPSQGKKICYALDVRGYLYEWLPEKNDRIVFARAGEMSEESKIPYLKEFLNNKRIFLPLIYAEWRKLKYNRPEHQ
jgi:hypothetical protein